MTAWVVRKLAETAAFFKSEVEEERQVDFDTYYATQPTIAVFLFIYFVATMIGCGGQAYHCWQGSRDEAISARPWLARGLRSAPTISPATLARWHCPQPLP